MRKLTEYQRGVVVGLLLGEGSFYSSGRSWKCAVKMHIRSHGLLETMRDWTGLGRIHGPYHHGGRSYSMWVIDTRNDLLDLCDFLDAVDFPELCTWVGGARYGEWRKRFDEFSRLPGIVA